MTTILRETARDVTSRASSAKLCVYIYIYTVYGERQSLLTSFRSKVMATMIRCFVTSSVHDKIAKFPAQILPGEKVANFKSVLLKQLQISEDPKEFELVFSINGVHLDDEATCDILRQDDFLILCKKSEYIYRMKTV